MLRPLLAALAAGLLLAGPALGQAPQELKPRAPTAVASVPAPITPTAAPCAHQGGIWVDAWLRDGYLPYALANADIAGAVVVVVKDGQVLSEKGYGYADLKSRRRVDPQTTLFRPGSVSKLFTWTAVMQQVELGKIDLDADVNRYLDFKIPPRDGKPVTMRNLMTHTAGFAETIQAPLPRQPDGAEAARRLPKPMGPQSHLPARRGPGLLQLRRRACGLRRPARLGRAASRRRTSSTTSSIPWACSTRPSSSRCPTT